MGCVSAAEIDDYLAGLDPVPRSTLEALRRSILAVVPDAEQCISYGMPGFRVGNTVVAGFAAFKNHLSYFPHSGSVLPALGDAVAGYGGSKGTLQFAPDQPLPDDLVRLLVETKLRLAGAG